MRRSRFARVPFIPQLELAECGAACLCMVLAYHRSRVPLAEVREHCGSSRDGTSAGVILRAARAYGLIARAFRAEPTRLADLPLPAILHWDFNHFVVLERIGPKGAVLVDPASGRRSVSPEQLDAAYTGVVVTLQPSAAFQRREYPSGSLARYLSILRDQRPAVGLVLGFTLVLDLLGVCAPMANQFLVDHVLMPERYGWLLPLAAAITLTASIRASITLVRERVLVSLSHALDLSLACDFVDHLLRLPLRFLRQRSAGDLLQRVSANATLRELATALVATTLDVLLIVSYGALLVAYDFRLGGLVLATSLLRVGVVASVNGRNAQDTASVLALESREHTARVEGLMMPETVRAFAAEQLVIERFVSRLTARLNAAQRQQRSLLALSQLTTLFDAVSAALLLGLGASLVIDGELSTGGLIGVLTVRGLLAVPLAAQLGAVSAFIHARGVVMRVDDVLHAATEANGSVVLSPIRGEIELEHVSFRYADPGPLLCDELCLSIRAGEKIAIVGRNGSGKTTLSLLLLGLLEPTAGCISFDGLSLRALERESFRRQLGVVLQDPQLFDDSVEANLRLVRPDASLLELQRAAALACVDDVIAGLPDGFLTRLGPSGNRLSRGQRQRLAIARALVNRPRILLLDEATSSLDLETEARVHANLAALRCTRIVIAHRLATVRDADRVLVLDQGRVVQQGSYADLVARQGLFQQMVGEHAP